MTPYTIDAVRLIKAQIQQGQPSDYVRNALGWDASMFDRVCQRHGIDRVAPSRDDDWVVPVHNNDTAVVADEFKPRTIRYGRPLENGQPRVGCSFTLPTNVARLFAQDAERRMESNVRTAGSIVDEYLADHDVKDIQIINRAYRGTGEGYSDLNASLSGAAGKRLKEESARRGIGASVGRLVKAIIIIHLMNESVASR